LGGDQLSSIDPDRVREWHAVMVELVEAGELSPKTVDNARTYLSVVSGLVDVSEAGLQLARR